MRFIYSDGGRSRYFKADNVGDCCVRAICNATGKDYKEVYDAINELAKRERTGSRKRKVSNARNGVYVQTAHKYIEDVLGWEWHPTMQIGSGCKVHLKEGELPDGALIARVSRHYTCVKNGVLYDTYDCSEEGTRCVYGYWAPAKKPDWKWRKIAEHKLTEYDIIYEWHGRKKTMRIEFRDGKPYCFHGIVIPQEKEYICEITEGYDL